MADEIQQVCLRCNMPSEQRVNRACDEFYRRFGVRISSAKVKWLAFMLATGISQPVQRKHADERG